MQARNLLEIRDNLTLQDAADPQSQDVSGSPKQLVSPLLADHGIQSHAKGGQSQFLQSQSGFRRGTSSWKPGNRVAVSVPRQSLSAGTTGREKTGSERNVAKNKILPKQVLARLMEFWKSSGPTAL